MLEIGIVSELLNFRPRPRQTTDGKKKVQKYVWVCLHFVPSIDWDWEKFSYLLSFQFSTCSKSRLFRCVTVSSAVHVLIVFFLFFFLQHTRYGAPNELLELGRVTPGTYCTRQYDECYRKKCRLQSPNYPGMYPRNVTCYWTIRQKVVPTCKHAMVSISQENEHKALVKR